MQPFKLIGLMLSFLCFPLAIPLQKLPVAMFILVNLLTILLVMLAHFWTTRNQWLESLLEAEGFLSCEMYLDKCANKDLQKR